LTLRFLGFFFHKPALSTALLVNNNSTPISHGEINTTYVLPVLLAVAGNM